MTKKYAMILGAVFVLLGIIGFIPALSPDDSIFGLFETSSTQNVLYILFGLAGLSTMMAGESAPQMYARVAGFVFAVVTVLGFLGGEGTEVLGLFSVSVANNVLYLVIALSSLYAGYVPESKTARA